MNEHDEYLKIPIVIFNLETGLYDLFAGIDKVISFKDDPRKVINEPIIKVEHEQRKVD